MFKITTKRLEIFKATPGYVDIFINLLNSFDQKILKMSVYLQDISLSTLKCIIEEGIERENLYVVREKETMSVVGSFSILPEEREVGGFVAVEHWGKGYGREGFKAFVDKCLEKYPYVLARHTDKIVTNCFVKCGFRLICIEAGGLEVYRKDAV